MYEDAIQSLQKELNQLLEVPIQNFNQIQMASIPKTPGIYAIYDQQGDRLLYVGESVDLQKRLVRQHVNGRKRFSSFRRNLSVWLGVDDENELTTFILSNCSFRFMICEHAQAKQLEHFGIAVLEPMLNR